MSAKWVRSQQWDDQHLTGALWPLKVIVRVFSWISTAVVLLSCVAMYGILASVPVGLIAKIPTVVFYAVTFVLVVGAIGVLPVWGATRVMRARGFGRSARFVVGTIGLPLLCVAGIAAWWWGVWPHVRYDPTTGSGIRFFGEFIDRYQAVQVRRLPGMEMNELEFYSWWPLRVVLLLFVTNLVTATLRRIEFNFPRVGVLMVHTGIVTIALGSIYYSTHKQEGDVILLAGETDEAGTPAPGPQERGFYDNTRVALWVTQNKKRGWEARPLWGVPRYNDYNLDVVPRMEPHPAWSESLAPLAIRVPESMPIEGGMSPVDPDITFRIVGYASYCELEESWVAADRMPKVAGEGASARLRTLELVVNQPMPDGASPRQAWHLLPDSPARRADTSLVGVEYTIGMDDSRWQALAAELPAGTTDALVVEHPASGFKAVYPVQPEKSIEVGTTGYRLMVRSILEHPPMPIVTKGYAGADSSLAIVQVTPPPPPPLPARAVSSAPFERWVYARFPEISQDMEDGGGADAMPTRRDADPAIKITYIDASRLQAYFDERSDGTVRSLVRPTGGAATVREGLKIGDRVAIAPVAAIRLGDRMEHAVRVETPRIVPDSERDRERIGKHESSAIALEVRDKSGLASVHWIPFSQYLGAAGSNPGRDIQLADGRTLSVIFGRQRHEFWPPMTVRLKEFEMIPYPNSTTPQDYRSEVVVTERWEGAGKESTQVRQTSLNNPLLVVTPYVPPPGMPWLGRVLGSMMSVIAPNQYKFSQAGWDQAGWRQSEAMVASGQLKRPSARFTILGVGNNPGIYIIATGAIMMSVGIPWAFYLKPWLMARQKRKIQEQLARERGSGHKGGASRNGTAKTHESISEGAST